MVQFHISGVKTDVPVRQTKSILAKHLFKRETAATHTVAMFHTSLLTAINILDAPDFILHSVCTKHC
jgi:hypothetical protein